MTAHHDQHQPVLNQLLLGFGLASNTAGDAFSASTSAASATGAASATVAAAPLFSVGSAGGATGRFSWESVALDPWGWIGWLAKRVGWNSHGYT